MNGNSGYDLNKLKEELEKIKEVLSFLIPIGRYNNDTKKYVTKVCNTIENVFNTGKDVNNLKIKEAVRAIEKDIKFYAEYFPERSFPFAQAFLISNFVSSFLEKIGYLNAIVFLDIKDKHEKIEKRFLPVQLYDSNIFLYPSVMEKWTKRQKDYLKNNKDEIIKDVSLGSENDLLQRINKKYAEGLKRLTLEYPHAKLHDWTDLFNFLYEKSELEKGGSEETVLEFLTLDVFDLYEFGNCYKENIRSFQEKINSARDKISGGVVSCIPFSDLEQGNLLSNIYEDKKSKKDPFVYLIPIPTEGIEIEDGDDPYRNIVYSLCFFENKLEEGVLKIFKDFLTYLTSPSAINVQVKIVEELNDQIVHYAIRSAIAAIMSRNMSHNIGSHVLINLEKNGNGTDTDDIKHFLNYLRSRMDFLAQISTERPSWSLPTRFLQDLMYDYFQQICLLRYIGASENLDHKKLKVFFHFEDGQVLCPSKAGKNEELRRTLLKNDIWISVVGGVTGRQAFYVILENIVRNAAKHSYSGDGDLEIHIKAEKKKNSYCIEIWDNVSKMENRLLAEINKAIEQSIITEIGEVQKGNWGIAEMKISAAYLQKFDYQLLGQEGENNKKIIRVETTGDGYLKYVFHLPMSQDVAIIDMRGEEEQLPNPEGNSIVLKKTVDKFALMDTKDTDYEFMILFSDAANTEEILKKLVDNKGILLEKLATRLFCVGDEEGFKEASSSCPYIRKRIAVLDPKDFREKLNDTQFRLWLYVEWIKHLRDKVRGDDIVKDKKFHLYLKLTEEAGANQYNSDYIKNCYSYFIPPLVWISNDFDSDVKDQWQRLNNTVKSKSGSILSEIIEDVLIRENVPNDNLPVIAYPRHGPGENAELKNLVSDKRLIYAEELSGASPHFNILASPPTDDYQLKKLALWLIEGGLLRIAIADERIGKEIGNSLSELGILNISTIKRDKKELKVCESGNTVLFPENAEEGLKNVTEGAQSSQLEQKYKIEIRKPLISGEQEYLKNDVLIIHQGILEKLGFWKDRAGLEDWLLRLKQKIPFIIVTSGRGKPEEVPKNTKFVPFSDISQSFAGKYSTKFLLTYIIMHVKE